MTLAAQIPPPAANQEYTLLDHAVRLERDLTGRLALHVQLSRLSGTGGREQRIDTAFTLFQDLVRGLNGQLFQTMEGDIIFVGREDKFGELSDMVARLRQMFADEPLARTTDENSQSGFSTWYVLERDYPQFVALARRLFEDSEAKRQESRKLEGATAGPGQSAERTLTPSQLGQLEEALSNMDLSAVMRQQPICVVTKHAAPQVVLHEIFVSIGDLGQTLLPGVSIASDPWLFQRLTRTLDSRVLRQVAHDHAKTEKAFSLNLNVATVLSPDFRRFEQAIGTGVRGRLVVEFQQIDIFADMPAFLFAREYLRELGFRVCIDGLNHLTLPFIDRETLGLDLLKMHWSDDVLDGMGAEAIAALERAVAAAGTARIIMCRCESETAMQIGCNMGISLFQGRHVDALLARG